MFRQRLIERGRFRDLAISANANRLVRMAERHGRFVECHQNSDGSSTKEVATPTHIVTIDTHLRRDIHTARPIRG
jgi:hypothetical protein